MHNTIVIFRGGCLVLSGNVRFEKCAFWEVWPASHDSPSRLRSHQEKEELTVSKFTCNVSPLCKLWLLLLRQIALISSTPIPVIFPSVPCGSFQSPSKCWMFIHPITPKHITNTLTTGIVHLHHDITIPPMVSQVQVDFHWALQLYSWHQAKGNLKTLPYRVLTFLQSSTPPVDVSGSHFARWNLATVLYDCNHHLVISDRFEKRTEKQKESSQY